MLKVAPPMEEVVKALLDYLVDPMLPLKASGKNPPSLSNQQSVAKQMHAVVLLYNYYHRKQQPELRFLEYEPFCQLALNLKPVLVAHMNCAHQSETTLSKDLGNQLSMTEKAVMDACNISLSLDALRDVPNAEAWPIAKVSVLLIDSKKENCVLLYSSITNGVWSVIEECLNVSDLDSGIPLVGAASVTMRVGKRTPTGEKDAKGSEFEHLAFAAVKKATGIHQSELMILERHVVYSLCKEKTAAYFYIMQCIQASKDFEVPIKDAIESLQGPLLRWISTSWTLTQVVEYYHVLPYAMIMSSWYAREVTSKGSQSLDVSSFEKGDKNCSEKIAESEQAILNDVQNFSVGLGNIEVNSSLMSEDTCGGEFRKSLDIYDRSYNDVECSSNETTAAEISKIVEKEVQEMEKFSESVAEEASSMVEKEAQEMVISDLSCDVSLPTLEKLKNNMGVHCSGGETIGTDNSKLREMESEENEKSGQPLEIIQPKVKQLESCIDATCISKETVDSENLNMVEIEIEKTEKSDQSLDMNPPIAGKLEIGPSCKETIGTVYYNRGVKEAEETEISDKLLDINDPDVKHLENDVFLYIGEGAICSYNSKMVEKEVVDIKTPDTCPKITHSSVKELRKSINADCSSEETIDDTSERIEKIVEDTEKSDKPLDKTPLTAGKLEIGPYCKETIGTVNYNGGAKEAEVTENSDKLLDINYSAVKHLENDVFLDIGEGAICSDNSKMVEKEVADMKTPDTCSKVTHSSVKELRNSINADCSGKETIGDNSDRMEKLVEDTEKSDKCCDVVKLTLKKLSCNDPEDSKKYTTNDLQIIHYPPRKRQKMNLDRLMMNLRYNKCKNENAEVPIRVYHHLKRKIPLKSGASTSVTGAGVYVETAGIPKSLSGKFREEKVTGNSINGLIESNLNGTAVPDCALVSILAKRDIALTQTALGVLFSKRAKLFHQQRTLQDEIALCDRNIQKILEGKEEALALKLDAIIDGCKDMLQREDSQ